MTRREDGMGIVTVTVVDLGALDTHLKYPVT